MQPAERLVFDWETAVLQARELLQRAGFRVEFARPQGPFISLVETNWVDHTVGPTVERTSVPWEPVGWAWSGSVIWRDAAGFRYFARGLGFDCPEPKSCATKRNPPRKVVMRWWARRWWLRCRLPRPWGFRTSREQDLAHGVPENPSARVVVQVVAHGVVAVRTPSQRVFAMDGRRPVGIE